MSVCVCIWVGIQERRSPPASTCEKGAGVYVCRGVRLTTPVARCHPHWCRLASAKPNFPPLLFVLVFICSSSSNKSSVKFEYYIYFCVLNFKIFPVALLLSNPSHLRHIQGPPHVKYSVSWRQWRWCTQLNQLTSLSFMWS